MLQSRALIFVAGIVLLTSCVWCFTSQTRVAEAIQGDQPMNFTVEGKVNTLGQNKLTLNSGDSILFHVRWDDKTEFKSDDGSAASSKDLHVGLRIQVEGDLSESGEIAAKKIELEKKK